MKKNISINISGIIFHIEEDGYDVLRRYLDSIHKYFSSFEDATEIMADIEGRIAEIFLSKLNEGKQVITSEDVNALMATMGSVSDFRAAEEQANQPGETLPPPPSGSTSDVPPFSAPKRLQRDQLRKILGGVCAGLANYLSVDIIWIRLLFALLIPAWGVIILIYLILWLVMPGSYDLQEIKLAKKMFRDPASKVLGGVSGGLAAYLNIDIIAVRILFIATVFAGGLGIFVYIVLWIILPEANSLTDRMQMQGQAVTLSNIESNIKKNQTLTGDPEESLITKIILFPFRLLAVVLQALGKILVPLSDVVRVLVGIVMVCVGLALGLAIIVAGGALIGVFSATAIGVPWEWGGYESGIPVEVMTNAFPGWLGLVAFLGLLVPTIFLILLGVSVIARRFVFTSTVGWSMAVVFLVSVAILSVGIPKIVYAFHETGEYETEERFTPTSKQLYFQVREVGMDDYDAVHLSLKGHKHNHLRLVKEFEAQGSSRKDGMENAQMVTYHAGLVDSVFTFDSNFEFKEDAIFRGQRLNMTLYLPYNYPFHMDEYFARFISQYVNEEDVDDQVWVIDEDRGLRCTTCPESTDEFLMDEETSDLRDFENIEINGVFNVFIKHGENYAVEMRGNDRDKDLFEITREGSTLLIEMRGKKTIRDWDWNDQSWQELEIHITTPDIERIEATGYGKIDMERFEENDVEIDLRGPIRLSGILKTQDLSVYLSGKAEADLSGSADNLHAELELASSLNANDLEVRRAEVEAGTASTAKVFVKESLEIDTDLAGRVDYRGDPPNVRRN